MLQILPRRIANHTFYMSALVLTAALPASAGIHLSVPQHSFLNYHAANVRELSQEVTLDPAVRARLAKHFHVSEAKMVAYIRQNLVLTQLKKSGNYRVACVRPNGEEFWVNSNLPAGTPVFASRATGQPILKLACGNPMVSLLPTPLLPNHPFAAPEIATAPSLQTLITPVAPGLMADVSPDTAVLASSDLSQPPVVEVSPSLQFLGGSSGPNFLPALFGLGGAIAVFGHGGSNSSATSAITPVPETSTFVSLGMLLVLGCGMVVVGRRKHTATV